jgi:Flp pilus assembly protein TadB
MKCYYHSVAEAVALCKSCSRALCHGCCADVPPGTACKGRCEEDVEAINLVIQRSKTAYQKTGGAYRRSAYWMLAMGLLFIALGIAPVLMGKGYATAFIAVMGVLFLFASVSSFRNSREISSSD